MSAFFGFDGASAPATVVENRFRPGASVRLRLRARDSVFIGGRWVEARTPYETVVVVPPTGKLLASRLMFDAQVVAGEGLRERGRTQEYGAVQSRVAAAVGFVGRWYPIRGLSRLACVAGAHDMSTTGTGTLTLAVERVEFGGEPTYDPSNPSLLVETQEDAASPLAFVNTAMFDTQGEVPGAAFPVTGHTSGALNAPLLGGCPVLVAVASLSHWFRENGYVRFSWILGGNFTGWADDVWAFKEWAERDE